MATAEWNQLYDRYYRKSEIYDMVWDLDREEGRKGRRKGPPLDLDKYIIAGAPFGGPIAMIVDERKVPYSFSSTTAQSSMKIYTSAGKLISSFTWAYAGLVAIGWTERHDLVCVMDDGSIYIYSVHGERINTFDLGHACREYKVAECCFWSDGFVVRTGAGKNELYAILSLRDHLADRPQPVKLADPRLNKPPTSMAVIPPGDGLYNIPEVLLATDTGTIIVVDDKEAQDQLLENGPFNRMEVSPNGEVVACFNDQGTLFVMSTDFTKKLSKFGTNSKVPPRDVVWCGQSSVVLYWDKILLMVGPYGDFVKYSYDSALSLITECDGVRIITRDTCEFLSLVHESTESIFNIGSTTSAALLYDAYEAFEAKSVKADENVRLINQKDGELNEAIAINLCASTYEFKIDTQKLLLKTASYGKLNSTNFPTDVFTETCKSIRVLNAIRHLDVGMPLTIEQYNKLSADRLIDLLIIHHHHLLSLRVCDYLDMPVAKRVDILTHWACAKIKADDDLEDRELTSLIANKMTLCEGYISFAPMASAAYTAGRKSLATMLLDYEARASVTVPLLLSMKQDKLALDKAIDSGDSDLVITVVLHLRDHYPFAEFAAFLVPRPMAKNVYMRFCEATDLKALKRLHYHLQKPLDAANIAVREAYRCKDWKERIQGLHIALEFYKKEGKGSFAAQSTEEQIRLLLTQRQCELEADGDTFIDGSVSDLITKYIKNGQVHRAMKVQQEFQVPEERLWHIEVRVLAACGAWQELAKLTANKRKPPIGFDPFIEACVEHKNYNEATKYIRRLQDPYSQMEWLCNIGYWQEAVEVATVEKDADALNTIRVRCRDANVVANIEQILRENNW